MTERERLIEMLDECRNIEGIGMELVEKQADLLLDNGVIVLPVWIGQKIWGVTPANWKQTEWKIWEGKVSMLQQKVDKSWKVRITVSSSVWDCSLDDIGTKYFLSLEEAERELERRNGND